jgi:hypothetical protein
MAILVYFSGFGLLYQEKSGNPCQNVHFKKWMPRWSWGKIFFPNWKMIRKTWLNFRASWHSLTTTYVGTDLGYGPWVGCVHSGHKCSKRWNRTMPEKCQKDDWQMHCVIKRASTVNKTCFLKRPRGAGKAPFTNTISCNFCQFLAKNWRFYQKTND